MTDKKIRLLDENSLETVTGGTEEGKNTGENTVGVEIPFCCPGCGTILKLIPGQKSVTCTNPRCGKVHTIDG